MQITQDSDSDDRLRRAIDHTLLKPEATLENLKQHCEEAKTYQFFSVCINPIFVAPAKDILKGSKVKVCTVVGFPLGASFSETKKMETRLAIERGADEIDMVLAIGALKNKNVDHVKADIQGVVEAASGRVVKVILETHLLTFSEIRLACAVSEEAGAHFVKTSTGFSGGGATIPIVEELKSLVGSRMEVKASGGIRSRDMALKMLEAGASRLGTSSSVAIMRADLSDNSLRKDGY